jgi:hypothetical protein
MVSFAAELEAHDATVGTARSTKAEVIKSFFFIPPRVSGNSAFHIT